jgi:hypothetical protein
MEKNNFLKAFDKLNKTQALVVKEVITKLCKWGSPQLFYAKKRGDRPISEKSEKNVDEVAIIETTFRAFHLDAWTGETI